MLKAKSKKIYLLEDEAQAHESPRQLSHIWASLPSDFPLHFISKDGRGVLQPVPIHRGSVGAFDLHLNASGHRGGEVKGETVSLEDERPGDDLPSCHGSRHGHETISTMRKAVQIKPFSPLVALVDVDRQFLGSAREVASGLHQAPVLKVVPVDPVAFRTQSWTDERFLPASKAYPVTARHEKTFRQSRTVAG